MNYNEAAKMLVEKGFYYTDLNAWSSAEITKALSLFMHRSKTEREQFLQKSINSLFDGYSYLGQLDSLNQGSEDLVHTFVISEFTETNLFPSEWQNYLATQFDSLSEVLRSVEAELMQLMFKNLDRKKLGHMVSCNYYPKLDSVRQKQRLSEHPDVSLFTIFPFGIDNQLEYEVNGKWHALPSSKNMVIITGYFAEMLSDRKIKALNHRVKQGEGDVSERFSFAFFSLPHPEQEFHTTSNSITAEIYYQKYLDLF